MTRYGPLQHSITGKWHFTVQEGPNARPFGPCADNCPGHRTSDEALLHYAGHLLHKRMTVTRNGNFRACIVCGERSNRHVEIFGKELNLCPDHMDTKTLLRFVDLQTLMEDELGAPKRPRSGLIVPA